MSAYAEGAAREVALLHWAESNEVGDLWSADDARWATALARATPGQPDLQRERARHAARRLGERDERLAEFLRRPLAGGLHWPLRAGLLGLLLGVFVERLGGAQMNLLALPLWGVLALQLIGYAVFIVRRGRLELGGLWQRLLSRGLSERQAGVLAHWLRLSAPLQQARAARIWHATLLGLSLGMVVGLYGRALQKEYVIGWESTWLQAAQVQRLADAVLAPARLVSGVAVPDVAPLQHGHLGVARTPAGPWLHLLAVTVLLVALPRAALLASASLRATRLRLALPMPPGPGDLRWAVVDPMGRLAGTLLAGSGEVLASPEGDRLFITPLQTEPVAPPRRWWQAPAAPAWSLLLQADALPAVAPGWPAQRAWLRALPVPPRQQAAWARLQATWHATLQPREDEALRLLADALAELATQAIEIGDLHPMDAVQRQVQPRLDALTTALATLYATPAVTAASPTLGELGGRLVKPLPAGRAAVLGGMAGGALAGLKADVATGGLTLGAGALAGALLGGLGAAGVNRRLDRRGASLQLDAAALPPLAEAVLARWLAALPHRLSDAQLQAVVAVQHWQLPAIEPLRAAMQQLAELEAPSGG